MVVTLGLTSFAPRSFGSILAYPNTSSSFAPHLAAPRRHSHLGPKYSSGALHEGLGLLYATGSVVQRELAQIFLVEGREHLDLWYYREELRSLALRPVHYREESAANCSVGRSGG